MKTVFVATSYGAAQGPPAGYEIPNDAIVVSAGSTYSVLSGENLMGGMDQSMSFANNASLGNPFLERLGVNTPIGAFSGAITGTLSNGSTTRFDFVADPDNAAKRAAIYRLDSSDPITSGATRIEAAWTGIPVLEGNDYTVAFSVRCGAWRGLADDIALFQVHAVDNAPGNPQILLAVVGGVLRIDCAYNANSPPLQASNTFFTLFSDASWPELTWMKFVIQFRWHWLSGNGPFLKAWRNGVQIANYTGPLGYNVPGDRAYVKTGVYHYTPPSWVSPLYREAHFKGPFIYSGLVSPSVATADLDLI